MMAEAILNLNSMCRGVFLALINISLQAMLLILLVWLMTRALRLRSAATRYHLWFLAVFGVVALPALTALLPGVSIPIARNQEMATSAAYIDEGATSMLDMEAEAADTSEAASVGRETVRQSWTSMFRPLMQISVISIISLIWFVVALFMLCRLMGSYFWLRHFKRKARKVEEGAVFETISRLKERMNVTRKVEVFISSEIHSPTSFGLLSTAIVLPDSMSDRGDDLVMVLSHEMAHARRHDYLVNLLQRILQSMLFFHPLFHVASHQLTREREHICDDWVIHATGRRDDYAECLIGLVKNAYYPRSVSVAMMGHHHNISRRVDMIIDNSRGIVTRISRKAAVSILLIGLILLPMLAVTRIVYTAEPGGLSEPLIDITGERDDILEEAETAEEEEGKPMKPEKKVRVAGIPDLNLGAAIREAVGKPEGPITDDDFQSITELNARYRGIRDITGIEKCVNLEELALSDNAIENISPLAQLTKLTSLSIRGNGLTDITPLSSLTNLTVLSIPANQISDLTPLANLSNLTLLRVESNQITDIEPLSKLTKLNKLVIAHNQIADVTPLAKLTNLNEELHAGGNRIADVTPLSKLVNLKKLVLFRNEISDVTALSRLTNLTRLFLSENQIADATPLANLSNLTILNLSKNRLSEITPLGNLSNLTTLALIKNRINEITPLAGLTNLTVLNIADNQISDITILPKLVSLDKLDLSGNPINDITPLSNLTNLTGLWLARNEIDSDDLTVLSNLTGLTTLALWRNRISNLEPLAGLTNLTALGLNYNQIDDITPLSNLVNLTILQLLHNQISDITPLSGLTRLDTLRLDENKIKDINPLSDLTNLSKLVLDANQVSSVEPLSSLTNLGELWIRDNQIEDIHPLVENSGLDKVDRVLLGANPLNEASRNTYIPELKARGVQILTFFVDSNLEAAVREAIGKLEGIVTQDDLQSITELEARDNNISDVTGIERCVNLEKLMLGAENREESSNDIEDISPLSELTRLVELSLASNKVSDVKPLSGLTNLTKLNLNNSRISDIAPLSNLTNLRVLGLEVNPLNEAAYDVHIPALQKRGATVDFDPKE